MTPRLLLLTLGAIRVGYVAARVVAAALDEIDRALSTYCVEVAAPDVVPDWLLIENP